jgi:O-antigen/teichoic acid export membrane protein
MISTLHRSDFVRKIGETYATQVTNLVLGLFVSVVVARSLGPAGRGLYGVAMAVATLGVQFGNLGLHASNTYFVAKERRLLSPLLGNALVVSFGLGGVGAAGAWWIFSAWPSLAPIQGRLLLLSLAWVPFGLSFLLAENLLLGIQEVRAFNSVEVLNRVVGLILIFGALFFFGSEVVAVFAAGLVALFLSLAWALKKLSRFIERVPWPSLDLLKDNFRISFKAYLITFLSFLVLRVDLLMVKYLLNAEQAGYYSIAASMADYCLVLPMAVGMILFPKLSAMRHLQEKLALTKKAAVGTVAALFPLLLIASLAARVVVGVMFGRIYLPSASAFIYLVPGIFTLGIELVIVQFLNSLGYPKAIIGVWVATTVLNIVANLWTIPAYGIVGASLVSSVTYTLTLLLIALLIFRHRTPISLPTETRETRQ